MRLVRLAAVVFMLVCVPGLSSAYASSISMFAGSSFVDVTNEQPKLQADLTDSGHIVSLFTGTTGAAWTAALAGAQILVIPELEGGNLFAAMDAGARTAVQSFVSGGGRFIISGDGNAFSLAMLNGLFGFSVVHNQFTSGGSTTLNAGAAAGTAFAGGPANLPNTNGTELVSGASLPAGALNLYSSGGDTAVFRVAFGSGTVVFLGYDWFETPTPGAWSTVLDAAVAGGSAAAVPEPASLVLLGTGLVALVVRVRQRAARR